MYINPPTDLQSCEATNLCFYVLSQSANVAIFLYSLNLSLQNKKNVMPKWLNWFCKKENITIMTTEHPSWCGQCVKDEPATLETKDVQTK